MGGVVRRRGRAPHLHRALDLEHQAGVVAGLCGSSEMADDTIGVVVARPAAIGRRVGIDMLVSMVTDVWCRARQLMLADAGSRCPTPLERQDQHQTNQQHSTHER